MLYKKEKKKKKKKRRGEEGERSGYSPKHEPAKQRYTVQSMECSLCAKVSEAQAVFSTVCRAVIISY